MKRERIRYLDAAKALGIFAVYFGHFGAEGGYGYPFAFYCVPLFFFVSGCTEGMSSEQKIMPYLKKKVNTILLPWLFFSIASIGVHVVKINSTDYVRAWLVQVVKGCIRNTFFAGALWFLTCLFVIEVFFFYIRKLKSRTIMILICLFFYLLAEGALPSRPASNPSWIWNIDSAMEYLIYYCLGFVFFPYINRIVKSEKAVIKITGAVLGLAVSICGITVFLGYDLFTFLNQFRVGVMLRPLLINCIVILFWLLLSYVLQNITILQTIGENTLFLCGNEFLIKEIVEAALNLLGINIEFATPLSIYVYAFILLILGVKFVVPAEKTIFRRMA